MILRPTFLVIIFLKCRRTCLPTQQVDSSTTTTAATTTTTTTTTVATTTTTVTEAPFPCTVCPKTYDMNCQGFGIPNLINWCPTAAEVGVTYVVGLLSILPLLPADTCSTTVVCPLGTTVFYNVLGTELPGPSPIIAWCRQSGAGAGTWNTGIPPLSAELSSLVCRPIVGG
ncbi:Sushi domain-containing protein [Caenorhabditis elegans]|uniref:Sushi domain-containing protein n=1 Tax=Caenorhabditis elegans TaxID=6239 RepID=O16456_CAEEL|nr:Sushi domain-containing protein [Caenorhabditis elegans]CCD64085.2 Sushi domain-containing protein [Caenorhabditis elegans]|eukprot:NP_001343618.1 Uncharacterized protein CELE_F41E6.8 [Caenorhabditis elegans]